MKTGKIEVVNVKSIEQEEKKTEKQITTTKQIDTEGIEVTFTNDVKEITQNTVVKNVVSNVVKTSSELTTAEVVSSTTKKYPQRTEHTLVFKTDKETVQVVANVDTKTGKVETVSTKDVTKEITETGAPVVSEVKVSQMVYQ